MSARAYVLVTSVVVLSGCIGESVLGGDIDPSAITGELREFDLYAKMGTLWYPLPGKPVGHLAFALSEDDPGTVPGPELRVKQGDTVRVTLHQPAGMAHTIHWHGLSVPWAMDGVPFMTQTATTEENTFLYEFTVRETGTYWYHCHVDAPFHIDFGLFGALIVEPRDAAADPPFDREATLILHEIDSTHVGNTLGRNATDRHPMGSPADAPEYAATNARDFGDIFGGAVAPEEAKEGTGFWTAPSEHYPLPGIRYRPRYDTFMINGKSFPETEPLHFRTGETLRVRLVNAGQLVHTMHLHGHHFLVTHKDGYKLPVAYPADSLLIGPGERYDIYVKGDNPGLWDFHDHGGAWGIGAYAANDHAFPGGMNTMLVYDDFKYAALPGPMKGHTSGDYVVFAAFYEGKNRVSANEIAHLAEAVEEARASWTPIGAEAVTKKLPSLHDLLHD